jgi:hypothetical protein
MICYRSPIVDDQLPSHTFSPQGFSKRIGAVSLPVAYELQNRFELAIVGGPSHSWPATPTKCRSSAHHTDDLVCPNPLDFEDIRESLAGLNARAGLLSLGSNLPFSNRTQTARFALVHSTVMVHSGPFCSENPCEQFDECSPSRRARC